MVQLTSCASLSEESGSRAVVREQMGVNEFHRDGSLNNWNAAINSRDPRGWAYVPEWNEYMRDALAHWLPDPDALAHFRAMTFDRLLREWGPAMATEWAILWDSLELPEAFGGIAETPPRAHLPLTYPQARGLLVLYCTLVLMLMLAA